MFRPEINPDSDRTADRQAASNDSKTPYEGKGKRPFNRQNSKKKPHFLTDVEKQAELVRFTENNLVSRRCTRYAPAYSMLRKSRTKSFRHAEEFPCECGMSYAWHVKHNYVQNADNHDTQWDIKTHGKDTITRDHGVIGFLDTCGEDHDHPRPYVRVKSDVSHEVIYELLIEHWSFPTPKLVLVIGGSIDLSQCEQSTSRQLELVLSDIIKSTGAWVITDGLSGDLAKCVGNAVRECASVSGQTAYEDFVLLGICSWDSVDGIASLICEEEGGKFPAVYHKVDKATSLSFSQPGTSRNLQAATYKASKNRKKLDENHTHFIFVDGEDPVKWRRKFEQYIASNRTNISHLEMNIPVVRLLIDCGNDPMKVDSTYFTPGIPNLIILLDDFFGDCSHFEQFIEKRNKKAHRSTEDSLNSDKTSGERSKSSADNDSSMSHETEPHKMVRYVNFHNASTGAALIREIMEVVVEEAEYLKSWRDYPDSDISISFGENGDSLTKLMLAVVLRQPEYARTNVLNSTVDYKALLGDSLHDLFSYFLIHNDYKFVKLFIDCGINLDEFLTLNRINVLYEQVHEQSSENSLVKFVFSLVYMKHEGLVGDSWTKLKYVGELLRDLTTSNFENEYEVNGQNIEHSRHSNPFKTPAEQHLLLWAALFNRDHLAKIFWRSGVNHIGMALVVWRLSSELSHKASQQNLQDVADNYDAQKRIFEKLAVDVLDECFHQNPRLTIVSLTRQVPTLFGSSALAIATEAKVNSFTEHASCQLAITRQWNGNMSPYTSWLKVSLVAIFLPLLPVIRFMRRNELEPRCDDEERFDPGLMRSVSVASTGVQEKFELERRTNVSYYNVGHRKDHSSIAMWKAFWFFVNAPVTKFVYHAMSYMFFLIVLSIFVLTELAPIDDTTVISAWEYITWIWLAGLISEELQQITFSDGKTFTEKLKKYYYSGWNILDMLMHVLLLCAIILRFTRTTPFSHTRGLYVVAETLFIIRIIHISLVTELVGVKVRMILEMLKDIRNFLVTLAVFLFSFGIAYRSLLYPEAQLNENLLLNIMFKPYFILFGQIPSDEFMKGHVSGCNSSIHSTIFGENDACPQQNKLAGVYLAIYCFVSNIMLVNLLIASLGQTFERMQERSEKIWRSDRYSLVEEFHRRSCLICPLNIFVVIGNVIFNIINCCKGSDFKSKDNEVELTERGRRRIELFEKEAMESCWPEELTPSSGEQEWLINSRAALFCNNDRPENEDMLTHITKIESSLDSVKDMWNTKPLNLVQNSSKTLRHCRTCTKKRPKT